MKIPNVSDIIDLILRPSLPYVVKAKSPESGVDSRVVGLADPGSYICEQYRKVITNLEFCASEKHFKSFLITSAARFEGKSVSSANISTLVSNLENKKVLLIDGDLRKPHQHHLFNLPRKPGLSNIFLEHLDFNQALHQVKGSPNLYILTAGSDIASPAELFSSEHFKAFIAEIKMKFDYVIIDTPPLMAVTDACVIAKIVDGVIVTAAAHITPEPALRECVSLLRDVKANIVGLLLTHTHRESSYYYAKYYKYYKYYRYTYGAGKQPQD